MSLMSLCHSHGWNMTTFCVFANTKCQPCYPVRLPELLHGYMNI